MNLSEGSNPSLSAIVLCHDGGQAPKATGCGLEMMTLNI